MAKPRLIEVGAHEIVAKEALEGTPATKAAHCSFTPTQLRKLLRTVSHVA